ncbi:MAG: hypothetical protein EXQ91_03350 [Alphaproteobacteria bacterium]|nr:hypothetical protein [Alphaproteobacteria bacterium]
MSVAEDVRTQPKFAPKYDSAVKFSTRRPGHANIFISDLDRSYAFYNGICGFEGVGFERSIKAGFVSNGNTHHDFGLVQADFKPRFGKDGKQQSINNYLGKPGLNHIGWETVNQQQLVEAYKRGLKAGIEFKQVLHHGGSWAIYMCDPDGSVHEFYADTTKDWRRFMSGAHDLGLITSQWNPLEGTPIEDKNWIESPEYRHYEGAPMHALRVARTVFHVSSIDYVMPFYRDVAGLEVCYTAPDKSYAYLRGSAQQSSFDICLIRNDVDADLGYHHIACEMANEKAVDDAEANLAKAGVPIFRRINDSRKRSFFLQDPDKLLVEFFVERKTDYAALAAVKIDQRALFA